MLNRGASFILSTILAAAIATTAMAQTGQTTTISKAELESLHTLRNDLRSAIGSIRAGLPIYEGSRGKAMEAAHQALTIVEAEITAATPPAETKPTPAPKAQTKESKKAPSKEAKPATTPATQPTLTDAEKVTASQASMRKGLASLQKTLTDLKAATSLSAANSTKLQGLIQTAASETDKSIALHATEG